MFPQPTASAHLARVVSCGRAQSSEAVVCSHARSWPAGAPGAALGLLVPSGLTLQTGVLSGVYLLPGFLCFFVLWLVTVLRMCPGLVPASRGDVVTGSGSLHGTRLTSDPPHPSLTVTAILNFTGGHWSVKSGADIVLLECSGRNVSDLRAAGP